MNHRSLALLCCALLTACGKDPGASPPPGPGQSEVAETTSEVSPPPQGETPTQEAPAIPMVVTPRPPLPPPPKTTRQVVELRGGVDLQRTVEREDASPEVRYAALRRLEELDSPHALPSALTLLRTSEDSFLKTNAVAFLARSTDPRAEQALEALEPRLRQLARALRAESQRDHERGDK